MPLLTGESAEIEGGIVELLGCKHNMFSRFPVAANYPMSTSEYKFIPVFPSKRTFLTWRSIRARGM